MNKIITFFVLCTVYTTCKSGLLETIGKCNLQDMKCQKQLYESALHSIAATGDQDIGIPVLDPMELKNIMVTVLGMVEMTMVDGVAEGVKDVKFEHYDVDFENGTANLNVYFEKVIIKGNYDVKSTPVIEQVMGNVISGNGFGSVVMEQLLMNYSMAFTTEKRDDGEVYIILNSEKSKYEYEVGKTTFEANSVKFGILEISPLVINFMNRNSNYMMNTFGKPFSDKAVDMNHDYLKMFFNAVPATRFLSNDLVKYAKVNNAIASKNQCS